MTITSPLKHEYSSFFVRVSIHLLFWSLGLTYLIYLIHIWAATYAPEEMAIPWWLAGASMLNVVGSYYWIASIILPHFYRRQWSWAFLHIGGVYLYCTTVNYFFYQAVAARVPVPPRFLNVAALYEQTGLLPSLWSDEPFYFGWMFTYGVIVIPVCLKMVRNAHAFANRAVRLERDNVKLELGFLRSQVNPHFLFNTLNNLHALIEQRDERASAVLLKLSAMMRYTLHESSAERIALEKEVDFVRDYLDLERLRHGPHVQIRARFEGDFAGREVAPLLLIGLVENAFKHGVNATIRASTVDVTLLVREEALDFSVTNSKAPHRPDRRRSRVTPSGFGLANLRRRLELLYPEAHHLFIRETADLHHAELTLYFHESAPDLPDRRRRAAGSPTA